MLALLLALMIVLLEYLLRGVLLLVPCRVWLLAAIPVGSEPKGPVSLVLSWCADAHVDVLCCWCHSWICWCMLELPCCLIGLGLLRLLACSGFLSSIVLQMQLVVRLFAGWCHFWCCLCRLSGILIVMVLCSVVVLSEVLRLFLELLVPVRLLATAELIPVDFFWMVVGAGTVPVGGCV
ncbi:hypothetical protein Nepgr_022842 [Nepenthes gracilis]|uniref:Uncharacterized protein n=1 Tax=Nepenthes gracilis TaxID=150966 RepID=A0AAD3XYJ0_NEPGR|nr:hypothetical protein Nepgr_022842 [Nepenthes gracilis]